MEQIAELIADKFDRLSQQERRELWRLRMPCTPCRTRGGAGRRRYCPLCEARFAPPARRTA